MYKFIVDDLIVDVVKKLRYVRYIPELKKVVVTTRTSAQAVCGSDNKTLYALPHTQIPENKKHWKYAKIVEITETEYNELSKSLKIVKSVPVSYLLSETRKKRITEMSTVCKNKIEEGFNCVLSDGTSHHFKLTIEDQLNLLDAERLVKQGSSQVLFHSTNSTARLFSSFDIEKIINAAYTHKNNQITYFNMLKQCINELSDIELLNKIEYGVVLTELPITEALKSQINSIL